MEYIIKEYTFLIYECYEILKLKSVQQTRSIFGKKIKDHIKLVLIFSK